MNIPRLIRSGLLLAAAAILAGCDNKSDAPASPARQGKKLQVAYIPKNTGNPYFNAIIKGFERGAADFGYDFFTTAPASAEATSQIPLIKEQVQRGIDVLAISPNSPDALNAVFDQARQRGVLVMVVNSDIPGNESHRDLAILPVDFNELGAHQVELMGSLIEYQGRIAILSATTDAPDQNFWIAGMKKALAQPKYKSMELVEIVYGDDDPQKSLTECEALLSKHPDLRGIIAPTSVGLAASAQGLDLAGAYPGGPRARGKGVELTGLGTPSLLKRYVEKGVVKKFALWDPGQEGYLAGYLATQMKNGKRKPLGSIEVPKLGKREFSDHGTVVTGPPIVFTKENIQQFEF